LAVLGKDSTVSKTCEEVENVSFRTAKISGWVCGRARAAKKRDIFFATASNCFADFC